MIETKRLKLLKECAFLTGSVRWGCDKPYDEDYVVLKSDWDDIVGTSLGNFYYEPHEYNADHTFQCFWLDYNGTKYNFLIPYETEEFFVWMKASIMMDGIQVKYIQNKAARTHLFETFKSIIRKEYDRPLKLSESIERYTGTGDDIPF